MQMEEILHLAVEKQASDIFLIAGLPVTFKCKGVQERAAEERLLPDAIEKLVLEIYEISHRQKTNYEAGIDDDFSVS